MTTNKRHPIRIIVITWLLVLIFAGYTPAQAQQDPGPDSAAAAACFIVGGIVVGVMIWGIWKMCKKIPKIKPPTDDDSPPVPPVPTNAPPTNFPGTNKPPIKAAMLSVSDGPNDAGVAWYDISDLTNRNGGYQTLLATSLQSSPDLKTWTTEYYILGWTSSNIFDGVILMGVYDSNWVNVATRYGDVRTNNNLLDFGETLQLSGGPNRFYRATVPARLHR